MKVECKLHDYSKACWRDGEYGLIVQRPTLTSGNVIILLEGKQAEVDAYELIEAVKACTKP